ncbi:hypothetical protein B0H16DRAFT_1307283, partial [Mycena metata]
FQPHQGTGGGQAIEDAHMLARLLAHPSVVKKNIPAVLELYQKLRLGPTQDAAEKARINGSMYEFNHSEFLFNDIGHPEGPPRKELEALGNAVGASFGWLAKGHTAEDWTAAN